MVEEKLRRESKAYLDKLFKKYEERNCGAVSMQGMKNIMHHMFPEFSQDEELEELMEKHLTRASYTVLNKQTSNFDVEHIENTIDFPSAQFIVVYFLKKLERRNTDAFSGKGLIRFTDFGQTVKLGLVDPEAEKKRRMY